jgi:signal peptidase II
MGPGTTRLLAGAGIAAGATLAVDQLTKAAARSSFEPNEVRDLALDGQVAVGHVQNHGSAYGLVGDMPAWAPAVGTAVIGGTLLALAKGSRMPTLAAASAGMVIGGGIGNVVDRIHQGHVTDMIHTGAAFHFYNVADAAIVGGLALGVGLLMIAR